MLTRTLSRQNQSSATRALVRKPTFRPQLDILEDRVVPAVLPQVNLPIDVGDFEVVGGQLQAPVTIAGQQAGNAVVTAASTTVNQQGVPILNLHIEDIHLNVLGLHVDTSDICLDITANPNGGLLGQLLGGLGGTNNAGLANLGAILDKLDDVTANLNTFLTELDGLLDGVLGGAMTVTKVLGTAGTGVVTAHPHNDDFCDILNLSLGPVNLNLLGLNVSLDNCVDPDGTGPLTGGPVTVDVTAHPEGGLLGNLLCGLADGNLVGLPISRLLGRLDRLIDRVGDLADSLNVIGQLPDRFERIADRLVDQLEKFASKVDSLADVDRLLSRIDKTINRLEKLIENTDAPAAVTKQLDALLTQMTRIVNAFRDLGFVNLQTAQLERVIDMLMARL